MKKYKLYHVAWEDIASKAGWFELDSEFKTFNCITCGYLIKETKKTITVVSTIGACNQGSHSMTIPKVNVIRKKYIGTFEFKE